MPRPLAPARPIVPKMSPDARKVALSVLNRVLIDEGYASLSLDEQFQQSSLSPRDKRLAAAIVYKTLEDLYKLDYALKRYLKDAGALDPKVLNILRLSACQILLMDKVPDFAAVNEAVDLARSLGREDMTGLVNGVLRSLIRGMDDFSWPKPDDPDYLSVTYSIPQWLIDRIISGYGIEKASDIIAYRSQDHAITLRRNAVLVSQEAFDALIQKKAWTSERGKLPGVWRVRGVSDLAWDLDFREGRYSVQGEGSMLAALAVSPRVGAQVLDCCAAPGGKTCYLAEMMQNTGRVHAWDLHEHRVALIQAQADRLRLYNIRPAVRDAAAPIERLEGTMDAVLLDAPCSGSGVMDSKPDIKYRLTPEDLTSLVSLQETLLDTCSQYVKPRGILVYATCSLLKEENEMQVARFLTKHPEFEMDELPEGIPEEFHTLAGEHGVQLLPHRDATEGFFFARLRRTR